MSWMAWRHVPVPVLRYADEGDAGFGTRTYPERIQFRVKSTSEDLIGVLANNASRNPRGYM